MDEMEAKIQELQKKLQSSESKCAELLEKDQHNTDRSPAVLYHSRSEKFLKKFQEGDDIDDWVDCILNYIDRFKCERDKVECILSHLDKRSSTEVKFRVDRSKTTATEVLDIMKKVYGIKETYSDLETAFHSREQHIDESLNDFSYALMDLMIKLKKERDITKKQAEQMLKARLAEGVSETSLKHELRRLNREQTKLEFFEFRDLANQWVQDDGSKEVAELNETHANSKYDKLMEIVQANQEEMKKLSEAVFHKPSYSYQGYNNIRQQGYNNNRQQGYNNSSYYQNRGRHRGSGQYRGRGIGRGSHETTTFSNSTNKDHTSSTWTPTQHNASNSDLQNGLCFYCHQPNHIKQHCLKFQQDTSSSNYNHSK